MATTLKPPIITTPKIEVVSKKITLISKAQFGETNAPGSQFVTSQLKSSSAAQDKFSVGRLVAMGVIGGGVGYGVASLAKSKNKWLGAALGGAAGAVGSLLVPSLAKASEADVDVTGAFVLPDGKASIVLVGPKSSRTRSREGKKIISVPMFITDKSTKLPGWVGVIFQHGMLVQRAQMHYVWDRAQYADVMQVAPDFGYYFDVEGMSEVVPDMRGREWGVELSTAAADKSNFHNSTLWTERFAEWPSPAWPRFGLNWNHPCDYSMVGDQCKLGGEYGVFKTPILNTNLHRKLVQLMLAMAFSHGKVGDHTRRAKWQGLDTAFMKYGFPVVGGTKYILNTVTPMPDFWKQNVTRYGQKYDLLMRRAQWFVWAAEMFRVHAGVLVEMIPEWRDHCTQWGVGCASTQRLSSKHTMLTWESSSWMKDADGKRVASADNPVRVQLERAAVIEYLKLVMEETPAPFTTAPRDQLNVVPTGAIRWLLDMPDGSLGDASSLGAILPPLDAINKEYFNSLIAHFDAHDHRPTWVKVATVVMAVVVSIMGTIAGGAGAIVGGLYSLACTLFVTYIRMGSTGGGMFAQGDIARSVGRLLSSIVAEAGINLEDFVGDTMQQMFSALGDKEMVGSFTDSINSVMTEFNKLKNDLNWPYVDEVFGTILDNEALQDIDVDSWLSQVSLER